MVIIQAIIALVLKSAGRILNMAFGWATVMLFGKVPQRRQIFLSLITFGSVLWMLAVLGIAFPKFAAFLLTFAQMPEWVEPNWIRLGMLIAAVVIPALVGCLTIVMLDPQDRPRGAAAKTMSILKGYPYTLGLALTVIFMTIFAPILKARDAARGWKTRHIAVLVHPGDYAEVVTDISAALTAGRLEVRPEHASWILRFPIKLLTVFAGNSVKALVSENLTTLRAPDMEILLYPSDLVISGREKLVFRAYAVVTERLAFSKAYLTASKEANELEDKLRKIWLELQAEGYSLQILERLRSAQRDFHGLDLPYDEWGVLFRAELLLERALLAQAAGIDETVVSSAAAPAPAPAARV